MLSKISLETPQKINAPTLIGITEGLFKYLPLSWNTVSAFNREKRKQAVILLLGILPKQLCWCPKTWKEEIMLLIWPLHMLQFMISEVFISKNYYNLLWWVIDIILGFNRCLQSCHLTYRLEKLYGKPCFLLHTPMETEIPLQPVSVQNPVCEHIHICTKEHFPAQPGFSQQISTNLTEGVGLHLYAWSRLFLHLHSSGLYFLSNFLLCS